MTMRSLVLALLSIGVVGIGCSSGGDDNNPVIYFAATHDEIGGTKVDQVTIFVIFSFAGNRACFVKGALVQQGIDALPDVKFTGIMMTVDFDLFAHAAGETLAPAQFLNC